MGHRRGWSGAAVVVLTMLACGADSVAGPEARLDGGPLAVREASVVVLDGVHVVHTADGRVERDRAILVRDGRIEAVGAAGSIPVPEGALSVDGRGAWVTPGLIDMHVHMRSADAEAYVRSGITTVRNMWGYSSLGALTERIERGETTGPRVVTLSPGLDAPPAYWPETHLITDPARADSVVGAMKARGYREIKVYQDLSRSVYDSVVAATARHGLTFAGHKPSRVPVEHVIRSGQRSIEHLGGLVGRAPAELAELVALSRQHGTWHGPTLAVQLALQGDTPARAARRDVVAALHSGGARLLIGTDSGIDATQPGVSLVEEMELFAEAGVPPKDLLRMATVGAAEYLGLDADLGRIAAGYRADLALFDDNPLDDLDRLRSVRAVLMGDRWITGGSP
jgi:imidazolonepropionase-like amidohydrolase